MSQASQPIILEFIGLPGAGKTTLTRLVAERLAAEGYRCAVPRFHAQAAPAGRGRRAWRYASRAATYLAHLRLLCTTIRFGLAIRPLRLGRMKWLREIPDLVPVIRSAAARHDVVLLDQAILQAVWSATLHGSLPSAPLLERLIHRATAACGGRVVYLHLVVDPETAIHRIAGRAEGGSRFDRLPREEGALLLAANEERLDRIVGCATRATGALVRELDGRATVRELGDTILDFIETKPPERIALFLPDLTGGGAERVMVNLARGFAERGLPVDLVLVRAAGPLLPEVAPGVRVVELRTRSVLASLPALTRYLRRERPRVLLSTLNTANVVAIWASWLARSGTRVVVRQSNTLSRTRAAARGRRRLIPWLVEHSYRRADGVVAVSEGVARDLIQVARLAPGRVHVVPNPVVPPELHALAAEPLAHPWFQESAPPVVLGVGRLTAQKDFPTLIRAFAQVRRGQRVRLVILGEGEERPRLEALIRESGVADDVALPGFVPNPFAYMSRAAVLVLSSVWEGLPAVVVQALAVGTPVIATDCESGPREILRDGRFGLLVPMGGEDEIARGILEAIGRPKPPVPPDAWHPFTHEIAVGQYLRILE
jgi:glycosyltransferase involved in cell wall biosynthesis/thymidylate kinase